MRTANRYGGKLLISGPKKQSALQNVSGYASQVIPVGIALLLLVIPFFTTDIAKPETSSKNFYFYFCSIVLFLVFLTSCLFNKKFSIRLNLLDAAFILFTFCLCFQELMVKKEGGFSDTMIQWIFLLGLFLLVKTAPFSNQLIFIKILLLAGVLNTIAGALQLSGILPSLHTSFNITGGFMNPAIYAGYLITIFPLGLVLYFSQQFRNAPVCRYLAWFSAIGILLVLPSTLSRAAWLACVAAGAYFVIARFKTRIANRLIQFKKKAIAACLLLILACYVGACWMYSFKPHSAAGRVFIWKITMQIIKENILSGVGNEKFEVAFNEYQAGHFKAGKGTEDEQYRADFVQYTYNEPLRFACENGVTGLLLYLFIIIAAFTSPANSADFFLLAARASLVAIITFSLFSYPFHSIPIKLNFVILLAVISARTRGFSFNTDLNNNVIVKMTTVSLIILLSAAGIFFREQYSAYDTWGRAKTIYKSGFYPEAQKEFELAKDFLGEKGEFLQEYSKVLYLNKKYKESLHVALTTKKYTSNPWLYILIGDNYKSLGFFNAAETAYCHAGFMVPNKLYPHYSLALLYKETGNLSKAKAKASEVLKKEIKVPSALTEAIKNEMKKILSEPQISLPAN
jgi:O-antigen polymerase